MGQLQRITRRAVRIQRGACQRLQPRFDRARHTAVVRPGPGAGSAAGVDRVATGQVLQGQPGRTAFTRQRRRRQPRTVPRGPPCWPGPPHPGACRQQPRCCGSRPAARPVHAPAATRCRPAGALADAVADAVEDRLGAMPGDFHFVLCQNISCPVPVYPTLATLHGGARMPCRCRLARRPVR